MTHPVIGLTTSTSISPGLLETRLKDSYLQAILLAGGTPLLIPNLIPQNSLADVIFRIDGLLLTGGGDIHPDRYGGRSHPRIYGVDPQRDRTEIALVQMAISSRLPLFGICRGIQVINVAFGGSLYEDISDKHPGALKHDYYPDWPRDHLSHEVMLDPDSHMAQVLDRKQVQVNSLHHQAIHRLAPELLAVGRSSDGIVEGIELPRYPFGLGVQWHPECLRDHQPMRNLFQEFVISADQYRKMHHPAKVVMNQGNTKQPDWSSLSQTGVRK